MEENKIENIQNTPVEQNVSTTQNISVTQNVPVTGNVSDVEKKPGNKKTILFIIFGVAIVLIIAGVVLSFLAPSGNNVSENKPKEKKPEELLASLGINDYFKYVLTTDYEKDTNLLDINNEDQMFMYYYYNKNTKIYKIDFQDPTFEGNLFLTYAKYDDYMKYHEVVFGEKSKHEMSMYDISIEELKSVGNDVYHVIKSVPNQCQNEETTKNCYIKLTKDIENNGEVELSDVTKKDNVITGVVSFNSKTENFEFVYEEVNGENIIKTLKIVDSLDN